MSIINPISKTVLTSLRNINKTRFPILRMEENSRLSSTGALAMSTLADTHVSVYITFPVPEHVDFKSSIPRFYEITKKITKDLIYYAYAENGSNLMVQEGYKNAQGFLDHFGEVNTEFDALIDKVGKKNFKFMALGPKDQLELIKPTLVPLGCRKFGANVIFILFSIHIQVHSNG